MSIFTGAGVAIVTPMKENLEVDYARLEQLIDFQIENKTDAIIVCGTTGEASTLTHEEHLECIRVAVARTAKRVPVIAGTGSNCTATAMYLSKEARDYGADGVLVVTPYYNKATQKGLIAHFTQVAGSIDIPVILYNIPGRTGCSMQASTISTLVKTVDNIVGVKEATGDIGFVAEVMQKTYGEIDLYSGNDDQIVPIMSLGGKGVISVLANILPEETHNIVAKYLAGDTLKSLELQLKYIPLIKALFSEVNPIPVKKAMQFMGMNAGMLRAPLTEMEEDNAKKLYQELINVGVKVI